MLTAQLEVTPWSKARKGHLVFQPTGAHWDRAGSAEALGEQLGAIPKRAVPLDQAAARLLTLHFGEEEETAAEEPAVASGGGGTYSDDNVMVAGQFMSVPEWLAQQGATARVNIDRDLATGLGSEFWGHKGELPPVAAAAGQPRTSDEEWSGDEESVVTVRVSEGLPRHATSPAPPLVSRTRLVRVRVVWPERRRCRGGPR